MRRLFWGLLLSLSATWVRAEEPEARGKPADRTSPERTVFVLPVQGTIDQGMLYVFRRAFREVERIAPAAVILDLDTPGGKLEETREIIQWMRSTKQRIPVYAYVNPDAYSAGAIISLGANRIFMSPAGNIGDAMPILINPLNGGIQELPEDIREKMISPTRALVRGLAQENGYNVDMAEAMVDPDREFILGEVSCPKGELLTLTSKEATSPVPPDGKPLLAAALVRDIPELLEHVDLAGARVARFEEVGAERLARWITGLGPLLLALGVLGLFIEFKTPGFGVFGVTGIVLLCIYFFGHYVAGLAGYEEILLVFAGLCLLAIELFLIPGFGVVGVLGIILILTGSLLALIPVVPTDVPALPGIAPITWDSFVLGALWKFCVTAAIVAVGGWLISRLFPKTSVYHKLVLESSLSREQGFVNAAGKFDGYLGQVGLARTSLRPAGTAEFGDQRLDVVTSGDMIGRGARIKVVHVEGNRVVVEAAPEGENSGPPCG
ncbi:MAG: nodulation protein NfeD [Lentisphaeria bacterium]|nr:nodulation protein NfeD [Lentisphaeria bacterium]